MTSALILIVDDDRQIAEILQAFLEREGFRVVVAHDGVARLEAHRTLAPDLVVLDVRLPRLDGVEVLTELRRRGRVPVIMAAALGEDAGHRAGVFVLQRGASQISGIAVRPHKTGSVSAFA